MLLAHYDLICPRCGNLRSICSDPNIDWHPHESVCWPSATAEWGMRRLRKKHPDEKEVGGALHPLDGVRVFAADAPPEVDPFA